MIEAEIPLATPVGAMSTFVTPPGRGWAPSRLFSFYMDAPGMREELRDMARRIATAGYYVALSQSLLSIEARFHSQLRGSLEPGTRCSR